MGRKLAVLLVIGLLIVSGVAPVGVVSADSNEDDDDDDPVPPSDSPEHDFTVVEYLSLWSLDEDLDPKERGIDEENVDDDFGKVTESESDTEDELETSQEEQNAFYRKFLNRTDMTWAFPPDIAQRWNSEDVHDFEMGGDDESVHPPHADLKDGEVIKDAYVEIFAINPSTKVLKSEDRKNLLIAKNGGVYGTTDYRIETPEDETDEYPKIEYSVKSNTVEEILVYQDDRLVGQSTGSGSFSVDYSNLNRGGDKLRVEVVISATVEKKITRKNELPHDEDESGTDSGPEPTAPSEPSAPGNPGSPTTGPSGPAGPGTGLMASVPSDTVIYDHGNIRTETEEMQKTLTVEDEVDYDRIHNMNPKARFAKMPDGTMEGHIMAQTVWTGVKLPNEDFINNKWKFYTARNTKWDSMVVTTEDGDKTRDSDTVPVQVYAYPSKDGKIGIPIDSQSSTKIVDTRGMYFDIPGIPEEVTVDAMDKDPEQRGGEKVDGQNQDSEYEIAYEVMFSYNDWNPDAVRVTSAVRGEPVKPETIGTVDVRKTELDLRVLEEKEVDGEKIQIKVEIELTDAETGDPISTTYSEGSGIEGGVNEGGNADSKYQSVVVEGKEVNTGEDGTAVVTVTVPEDSPTVEATFNSQRWWNSGDDVAYQDSTAYATAPSTLENVVNFIDSIFNLLIPFTPAIITMYMISKAFNLGIFSRD